MALVLVTGASGGLGHNAAAHLAGEGHDVVVHARNSDRLTDAEGAGSQGAGRWAGTVTGDLSRLDGIHDAARQASAFGRFDAVIHNAGTMHAPELITVNTIAPYVLTALMDKPARLIYLSSSMHRTGSTDLERLATGDASYSDTKLWVTALALACASRWEGTVSHAVDPGWVPTRMGGRSASDDLAAGHQTQAWLATHPGVAPATGGYWYHGRTQSPHPAAADEAFQARLIDALERHTGVPLA
ncbi:SDR family NAD(P)-dependent oxidoreductase [Nocardiopsis sediminis]|uniref:SDR family NAD(P)-dependent oxidoreductase n=1 Tax=Nocardiopsis sediminis TaxID=1778267 RepID=A0ABV8FN97_9ACTN